MSPFYSSPSLQGADIVLHSLSKYINGHTDVVMGAVVLPQHHSALHGRLAFLQNAVGAVPSAYDYWLVQRGAKTFAYADGGARTQRVTSRSGAGDEPVCRGGHLSGPRFASKVRDRETVSFTTCGTVCPGRIGTQPGWLVHVRRDGLLSHPRQARGSPTFFWVRSVCLRWLFSLGGSESLAQLPGVTHNDIPPAERAVLGISDYLIRLSVGIEDGADLVRDIEQALHAPAEAEP
jgi:cystathionine gamma-lyase